jgi:hypothetical protein
MMDLNISRLRSISIRYSLLVFVMALLVFLAAIFIEATIIVESPEIGDMSDVVRITIGSIATIVGVVSGTITIYNFLSDSDESGDGGPADRIVVEGDLHYHLGDPTFSRTPKSEQTAE